MRAMGIIRTMIAVRARYVWSTLDDRVLQRGKHLLIEYPSNPLPYLT
jgi:hypothetical protein